MENYEWSKEMNCAVTVCDAEGIIIYMNDKRAKPTRRRATSSERTFTSATPRGRKR